MSTAPANLARHIGIVREFGLNAVVAVNASPTTPTRRSRPCAELALELGAHAAAGQHGFEGGGEGAPRARRGGRRRGRAAERFEPMYPLDARSRRRSTRSRNACTAPTDLPAARGRERRQALHRAGPRQGADLHGEDAPLAFARPDSRTRRPASPCRCAASAPTPARAGSSRSAATCRRCPGSRPHRRVQRRHRRERPHGWPLLSNRSLPAPRSSERSSWPSGLALLTARVVEAATISAARRGARRRARAAGRGRRRRLPRLPGHALGGGPAPDDRAAAADGGARRRRRRARPSRRTDRARGERRRQGGRPACRAAARAAAMLVQVNGGGDAAASATGRAARAADRL